MRTIFTDVQIAELLKDPKPIPEDFRKWTLQPAMFLSGDNYHFTRIIKSKGGRKFGLYIRQNTIEKMDFSTGLRLIISSNEGFDLFRCNGWHPEHCNKLDKGKPGYIIPENTCHFHLATERYSRVQKKSRLSGYAEATTQFHDITSALEFLIEKCSFVSSRTMKPLVNYDLFRGLQP